MALIYDLILFLDGLSHDPFAYSVVLFIYTIVATAFLPIPVEVGLFFSPETPIFIKLLILGLGRGAGSILAFALGGRIGGGAIWLFSKNRVLRAFMNGMQMFVTKTRYFGLYVILSTPLMVDTVPLYLFSVFNQEGAMKIKWFALTCFFAGITRASIVFAIFYWMGIVLV